MYTVYVTSVYSLSKSMQRLMVCDTLTDPKTGCGYYILAVYFRRQKDMQSEEWEKADTEIAKE